ncbi:MAG: MarR family EPS-associated transcriptional regulator, partial [Roseovarius sp.]|nr:MarR family EPS-associated transcriptional regulator [Roseovarius sp.]
LIKLGNFTAAEDRRRYAYVLTRKGIAEKARLTQAFLARKMEEYEALRAEIEDLLADSDNARDPLAALPCGGKE